jgi:hypothetical protein
VGRPAGETGNRSRGQAQEDVNGKSVYAPVLQWRNRELADEFSRRVVALVRQAHPDDLAE